LGSSTEFTDNNGLSPQRIGSNSLALFSYNDNAFYGIVLEGNYVQPLSVYDSSTSNLGYVLAYPSSNTILDLTSLKCECIVDGVKAPNTNTYIINLSKFGSYFAHISIVQ